jgi:hypothetical protein
MLSGNTLMYIAAELVVKMFFQKIGRVAIEGEEKGIQKPLKVRFSRVLIGVFVAKSSAIQV